MTGDLKELIEQVAAGCRAFYHSDIQPPATEAALERLQQRTQAELGACLPGDYLDFLRVTDGLSWNGLFFADNDISLYVYNLGERRYEILDRPSETLLQTFETFAAMLTEALRLSLHEDNENESEE